jgi:hypothetical protein
MGSSVSSDRDTGMAIGYFDIIVIATDGSAKLIPIPTGGKDFIGTDKGDLALFSQTGSD